MNTEKEIGQLVTSFQKTAGQSPLVRDEIAIIAGRCARLEVVDNNPVDDIRVLEIYGRQVAERIILTYSSRGQRLVKEYTRREFLPPQSLN